jgi:hypothetical protein
VAQSDDSLIAATSISKLPVDDLDREPPSVIGLNRFRKFEQFALGGPFRAS